MSAPAHRKGRWKPVVLYRVDPAQSRAFPPCPFYAATSLYCPGCGSLRATHQLLHANVLAAVQLNPLLVLSVFGIGLAFAARFVSACRQRRSAGQVVSTRYIWLFLILVVAYWALRNLPMHPFIALAPHTH